MQPKHHLQRHLCATEPAPGLPAAGHFLTKCIHTGHTASLDLHLSLSPTATQPGISPINAQQEAAPLPRGCGTMWAQDVGLPLHNQPQCQRAKISKCPQHQSRAVHVKVQYVLHQGGRSLSDRHRQRATDTVLATAKLVTQDLITFFRPQCGSLAGLHEYTEIPA